MQHILQESRRVSGGTYFMDHRTCGDTGPDDRRCFDEVCPEGIKNSCAKVLSEMRQ